MKSLCVLGITGSIGKNVSEVVKVHSDDFVITGCSFNTSFEVFKEIYKDNPSLKSVAVCDEVTADKVKKEYPELNVYSGENALRALIKFNNYDMVVNALVGFCGFIPTLVSLTKGIDVALANKESLVVGGHLIKKILESGNARLYPIDSEHVAIAKLLKDRKVSEIKNVHITASGGSFRDYQREELVNVTVEKALKHPSWNMGAKITIDSATIMNKGFEVIEARWLFDIKNIDVVIHRESVVHSMVEYCDNSIIAQMGVPSMKLPIQFALTYPEREECEVSSLDFLKYPNLTFYKPDMDTFGCLKLALYAMKEGGTMPLCLNSANEVAVSYFLKGKIGFLDIERTVEKMLETHKRCDDLSLYDTIKLDEELKLKTIKYLEDLN